MTSFPSFLDSPPSSPKFHDVSCEDFSDLDRWLDERSQTSENKQSPNVSILTMDDIVNQMDGETSILF